MKHNKPLSGFHNLILHVKAEKDNLFSHLASWVRLCDSDYGFPVQWCGAGKFEARMLCSADSFFFPSFRHLNAVHFPCQSVQSLKHSIPVKDRQTAVFSTLYILPYTLISDSCLPWSLLCTVPVWTEGMTLIDGSFLQNNVSWLVGGSLVLYSDRYGWIEESLSFCLSRKWIFRSPLNMMNWFIVFALNGAATNISFTYFFFVLYSKTQKGRKKLNPMA